MRIIIRQENENDYKIRESVVEQALKSPEHSDPNEHILVAKLRKSNAFIPVYHPIKKKDINLQAPGAYAG